MQIKKGKEMTVIVALASYGFNFQQIAEILQTTEAKIASLLFFEERTEADQEVSLTVIGEQISSDLFKFTARIYEAFDILQDVMQDEATKIKSILEAGAESVMQNSAFRALEAYTAQKKHDAHENARGSDSEAVAAPSLKNEESEGDER